MNASRPFVWIYELIRAPFDRKVGVGENKSINSPAKGISIRITAHAST